MLTAFVFIVIASTEVMGSYTAKWLVLLLLLLLLVNRAGGTRRRHVVIDRKEALPYAGVFFFV